MAGLVLALLLAAAGEPAVRVEKLAAGGFSADVADIEAARLTTTMEEVQRIAAQRCGKMKVRFGRYNFDSRVDTTRNVMMIENLRQKFFCYDPATDPYKPVPADWKASDADTAAATSFVTRFLDRLDRGDQAGIAMMDPLAEITPKDWANLHAGATQFQTGDGSMTPQFVAWSNNPDGAAYPGAYVLFSVLDDHPGIAGTCGGILVQRVREGEYRIAQYDVQFISQALVNQQGLTGQQLDRLCQR